MPCQSECRSSCDATVDRTADVRTDGDTSFAALVGDHPDVLGGLTDSGFVIPSPVQVVALPAIVAGNGKVFTRPRAIFNRLIVVFNRCAYRRHDRRGEKRNGQDAGVRRADTNAAETRTRPFAMRGFGANPRNRRPDTTVFQKSWSTVAK